MTASRVADMTASSRELIRMRTTYEA